MSLKLSPKRSRNYFLPLFVLCLFRYAAFVSACLHGAALHALNASFCKEFCLSNAHLRNANFCKWEMFSNIMGTVYVFVEIREFVSVTQWWHYSNSENPKNHCNAVSRVYSFSLWTAAPISCLWLPAGERKSTDYRCIPNVCLFHAFFREKQHVSEGNRRFVSFFPPNIQGQLDLQLLRKDLQWKQQSMNCRYTKLFAFLPLSLLILGKLYKWYSFQVSKQYDIATLFTLLPKAMPDGAHNSVLKGEIYCLRLLLIFLKNSTYFYYSV